MEVELTKVIEEETHAYDELLDNLQDTMNSHEGWQEEEADADELEEQEDAWAGDAPPEGIAAAAVVAEAAAVEEDGPGVIGVDPAVHAAVAAAGWKDCSTHNRFIYNDSSGRRAFIVFPLSGLKAVCQKHPNCVCWLNEKSLGRAGRAPLVDLITWGAAGSTQTAQQHYKSSQEVKASFGMKVKVPSS